MPKEKLIYVVLLLLAVAVNVAGINTPFFTDDPGLYGSIAKQMIYHHSWLPLYSYGHDWLDKPHFPFWAVLVSFKMFGIHTWSYKLPGLLFFALGAGYTYVFAARLYNSKVAALSVLLLLTAQHSIMSATDVRAEPYLVGFIIGSIYHISRLRHRFNVGHLLAAAVFTAAAIITKGVFVLIAIYGGLLGELIFTNSVSSVWNYRWLLLVLLTAIFITPEVYALYVQFDLHPEKVVFGHQHTSGIKFFLWDSQFGRFFNSGPITRKTSSVFFFVHTLLWAFGPWCLLLYLAFAKNIKSIIKGVRLPEYYTLSGGLLLLLLFSVSGFQLPFYTNILFPLFSILTASLLCRQLSAIAVNYARIVQWVYIIILCAALAFVNYYLKALPVWLPVLFFGIVVFAGVSYHTDNKLRKLQSLIYLSAFTIIIVNLYLIFFFYPVLISYKAELKVADYLNRLNDTHKQVYVFGNKDNNFQFYTNQPVKLISIGQSSALTGGNSNYAYIHPDDMEYLKQHHISFSIIIIFDNYQHENILPKFYNPRTRTELLEKTYLIKL